MASIEPRGKNSFRLIVENGYDAKGKRDRRKKTIRIEDPKLLKTKRKLQEYLEDQLHRFRIEVEAGEYIAPEKSTFDSFAEKWIEKKLFNKNGKPYSYKASEKHSGHLRNHILPAFGYKKIDKIKTLHIVDFIDDLAKDGARKDGKPGGLGDRTILDVFQTLQAMFKTATEEWKLIKENPMEGLSQPHVEPKEMQYFQTDEAEECIRVLYEIDIKWRLYFLGAMIGGLRRGEGLAFQWHLDVDWERGGFYVNRSISKTVNGRPLVKAPKSRSSKRFVKMPDFYMEDLAKYYRMWKKEKLMLGDAWEGEDNQYIFHSGTGKPYYYTTPTAKWAKIKKKYGLKDIRLHDLRHTMVALLIEAGENMSAIQKRAGHASRRITSDIYGHVTEKLENETAQYFDQFNPNLKAKSN
ncbi:tyrosine-type recombinase/integrase [Bacillus velezensis]